MHPSVVGVSGCEGGDLDWIGIRILEELEAHIILNASNEMDMVCNQDHVVECETQLDEANDQKPRVEYEVEQASPLQSENFGT